MGPLPTSDFCGPYRLYRFKNQGGYPRNERALASSARGRVVHSPEILQRIFDLLEYPAESQSDACSAGFEDEDGDVRLTLCTAAQVNIQFFYFAAQRLWAKLPSSTPLWRVLFGPSMGNDSLDDITVTSSVERLRTEEQLGYLNNRLRVNDDGSRDERAESSFDHFRFYSYFVRELAMNGLEVSPLVLAEIRRQLPRGEPIFPSLYSLAWAELPSRALGGISTVSQLRSDVAPRLSRLDLSFADGGNFPNNGSASKSLILERIVEAATTFTCLEEITLSVGFECTLPVDILRMFPTLRDAYLDCTMRDWERAALDERSLRSLPQNVAIRTLRLNWGDGDLEALASAADVGAVECFSISRTKGRCQSFLTGLDVISRHAFVGLVHLEIDSGVPCEGEHLPFGGRFLRYAGPLRRCHSLSEVLITLPGHSLHFTLAEFLSLCEAWPKLVLLQLEFQPASLNGIFDVCQVVRGAYKHCSNLVSIHLPGLKTSGRPFFNLQSLPMSFPLLHLSSNVFYSEHNPIDIAFALHHAFRKLITVGPVFCPKNSDWAMVSGLFHLLRIGDRVSATNFIGENNLINSGRYPFPLSLCLASLNMGFTALLDHYYYPVPEGQEYEAELNARTRA
ncbi:hypothetical protein C8Q79DRAFT_1006478 [Trametes meyenii]|nr:hypothetical protein C8Q79DRAFT_1010979 [Trametes meyenii]KAI0650190.1 hypothetical protein C8Q79DRAFT_1006478 [Trametes meyenii]